MAETVMSELKRHSHKWAGGIPAVSKQAMLALALVWNVSYVEYIVNKLSGQSLAAWCGLR
jgi:hypothetical protein